MFGLASTRALLQGFTPRTIISYIGRQFPKLKPAIEQAAISGYTANTILNHIVRTQSHSSKGELTDWERVQKSVDRKNRNLALGAAGLGIGLAGLGAAGLIGRGAAAAGSAAAGAAESAAPTVASSVPASTTAVEVANTLGPNASKIANVTSQALKTPAAAVTSMASPLANIELVKNIKADKVLGNLLTQGIPLEDATLAAKKLLSPNQIHELSKVEGGFSKAISDYSEHLKSLDIRNSDGLLNKSSMVMTPSGLVGRVKQSNKGHALIDSHGHMSQINSSQAQPVPKDWHNLSIDLSKIPEGANSSNIAQFHPSDDRKNAFVQFWSKKEPKMYWYRRKDGGEIPDEVLKSIESEIDNPVTSGETFLGSWSPEGKSRGSALYHKLKVQAQSKDEWLEQDDESKPYYFERVPTTYRHGFLEATYREIYNLKSKYDKDKRKRK